MNSLMINHSPTDPAVGFVCTRTGVRGWIVSTQTKSQPRVSLEINGVPALALRVRESTLTDMGIKWSFDAQWLAPGEVGSFIQLRMAEFPKMVFRSTIPAKDAKHAMYSTLYDYAVFYNPKSACTTLRMLFLTLHRNEVEAFVEDAALNHAPYIFPLGQDTRPEFKINVVRHPYHRVISAFFDKLVSYCYLPASCTGQDIFEHKFGPDQSHWQTLTFNDYLDYLLDHRIGADIHFQVQPIISGHVELVRVETLATDLIDVYQRRRPQLAPQVETFLSGGEGRVNVSLNSRNGKKVSLDAPHRLPISEIAELIRGGASLTPESFLNPETQDRLVMLLKDEMAAFGYTLENIVNSRAGCA